MSTQVPHTPVDTEYAGMQSPSVDPNVRQRRVYAIATDPGQGDRALELKLLSGQRPHMRAFHYAWVSFMIAFYGWFSIASLMPTIKESIGITKNQVNVSNIVSVSSTIFGRIFIGPLCDRYGSRAVQAGILGLGAIPVACACLISNYWSLILVRALIAFVGCAFVPCAYWTATMFTKEIVGTAIAFAAGWGNMGAGVTILVTPLIMDLFIAMGITKEIAWRMALVAPAFFMIAVAVMLYRDSEDSPHGNYKDKKEDEIDMVGEKGKVDMKEALWVAVKIPATWILAFQYAACFGVELQVHNVLTSYYYNDFLKDDCVPAKDANKCRVLTQTTAAMISSLFGLMCLFARALGGYYSDVMSRKYGMRGRIVAQSTSFAGQFISLYLYSRYQTVSVSVVLLIAFGFFVQMCTGTTYGIVPYVAPKYVGAVSGIVGAGGNIGALCWGFLFKWTVVYSTSFLYMSYFVAFGCVVCLFLSIEGEISFIADNSQHGGTVYGDESTHASVHFGGGKKSDAPTDRASTA